MTSRGRLAPSPTGAQHLGNARTHLIAYWAVKKARGSLALRIDDLDSPRTKTWAKRQAVEDLRWLGIHWDDGPTYQTDHLSHYQSALARLIESDKVYPCTCSRREIDSAASAPHESRFRGEGPIYPGTCSRWRCGDSLPAAPFCWRFRVSDREWQFDDLLLGQQRCNPARELGDFPVTQKSGTMAYQLAVVVDDALSEVDEVVRGNDLVPSTFRQLELYAALEKNPPRYAHVPLVCGLDGRRLAKRHGDTRLSHFREHGIAPEAIVAWAATSIGLIEESDRQSAAEIIERFDWGKLSHDDTLVDTASLFGV